MPPIDLNPGNPTELAHLRQLAENATRAAGAVAHRYFGTEYAVRLKPDLSEVSVADEDAQRAAIAYLLAQRPNDAYLTEEHLDLADAAPPRDDGLCWVIDPIDGTRNFVRHIPCYTCSIAVMLAGIPIAGAIYDPEREIAYSAGGSGGVHINGQPQAPIPIEARRAGGNPQLIVALPSTPGSTTAALTHAWLNRYVCRSLGSVALHMALVATGQLDAMLADNPRLWDLAAGYALITAVGGKLVTPAGEDRFPISVAQYNGAELPTIAAPPALLPELLNV